MCIPQMEFSNCQNDAHSLFSVSLANTSHMDHTYLANILHVLILNQISFPCKASSEKNSFLPPKMDGASGFLDIPDASLQMGTILLNGQAGGSMQKNHILNIYVIYCRIFPIILMHIILTFTVRIHAS